MVAPFPALVAAAEATERPTVGTFVLNTAFWNPALLAREVATTDALTGGRLELGLGTGYVPAEHERAGLEFGPPGGRVDHLRHTVEEVERLLSDEEHEPRRCSGPGPPLLIGGNGDRMLRMAAEHADIAAFTGARTAGAAAAPCSPPTNSTDGSAAYREVAAGRQEPAELNLLVQIVDRHRRPRAAVRERLAAVPTSARSRPWICRCSRSGRVGRSPTSCWRSVSGTASRT